MDVEVDRLVKLLFKNKISEEWTQSHDFYKYLLKLGTYTVDDLLKEPTRLNDEKNSILEQTQELACKNYKTFVQTAECSREIFKQFSNTEERLDSLLEKIPILEKQCEEFAHKTKDINLNRRLNSLTLTRNAQLLEILELPQLMDSFIEDEQYENALELASYVRRLTIKHPDIQVFKLMVADVEKSWLVMLHQLIAELRSDLQLPKCLQIVGHLRRMEVFTESELRLKFLQARDTWLKSTLHAIPNTDGSPGKVYCFESRLISGDPDFINDDNATQTFLQFSLIETHCEQSRTHQADIFITSNHHLNKTIELTRINLFSIVTQYRAIFNDDEHSPLNAARDKDFNENLIFFSWLQEKINIFLSTLRADLKRGVLSIDSILSQCMYFGLSFSRVGCDFRALMEPIFREAIFSTYEKSVVNTTKEFELNMERFTLINKSCPSAINITQNVDSVHPPESLLEFYPLAEYCNQILTAFNELRLCAPFGILQPVTRTLQSSLLAVSRTILIFYGQEQQAFSQPAKDAFSRLCSCFTDDLIPYLQRCLHVLYPPVKTATHLGVSIQTLHKENLSILDRAFIIQPIAHLLPAKIDPVIPDEELDKKADTAVENETTAS